MNPLDLYISYNRSVHVFIMGLAALLGPFFIVSGIDPDFRRNLIFGLLLVGYLVYHLLKAFLNKMSLGKTDGIAFLWVPLLILPLGLVLSYIEYAA